VLAQVLNYFDRVRAHFAVKTLSLLAATTYSTTEIRLLVKIYVGRERSKSVGQNTSFEVAYYIPQLRNYVDRVRGTCCGQIKLIWSGNYEL